VATLTSFLLIRALPRPSLFCPSNRIREKRRTPKWQMADHPWRAWCYREGVHEGGRARRSVLGQRQEQLGQARKKVQELLCAKWHTKRRTQAGCGETRAPTRCERGRLYVCVTARFMRRGGGRRD